MAIFFPENIDSEVRLAAFEWLKSREIEYGDVLSRQVLQQGFSHKGQRVPLLGPQGIFKPRILPSIPLSITTTPKSPYDDSFGRELVLSAYKDQCALCRLRHRELLDAAHIIPDTEPGGDPIVKNGIALCKLHHAAFDNFFIGIRPDFRVIVREDMLKETDGPMLRHGLQGLHNTKLIVPRRQNLRPDPELLERRWERFKYVS